MRFMISSQVIFFMFHIFSFTYLVIFSDTWIYEGSSQIYAFKEFDHEQNLWKC
jgi:hypothetical protein